MQTNTLRSKITAIPLALIFLVFAYSCTPSEPASPSPASPLSTASPPELLQSVQIIHRAISENRPDFLRSLIGDEGVNAVGFAMGAEYKGYNNADEIITAFSDALSRSKPICIGFAPAAGALPDKAILVYQDLSLDWSRLDFNDFSGEPPDDVTLQLFNLAEGWRLVYITPFDLGANLEIIGPLEECPFG